jgi:small-conductance mechanosensitive channel
MGLMSVSRRQLLAVFAPTSQSFGSWLDGILHSRIADIPVSTWLLSVATFLGTFIGTRTVLSLVLRRLSKSRTLLGGRPSELVTTLVSETGWYSCLALGLFVGTRNLDLPGRMEKVLSAFMVLAFAIQAGVWIERAVTKVIEAWQTRQGSTQAATVAAGLKFALRLFTWVILGLFALSNLGIEVGAMMAGLGVGGVAAALAVQNILGDMFAGVSMYFDRPFDIGDSIAIGDIRGEVEEIGLRTTRIASVDGEQIIVPNGDIGKSRIKNFARLRQRRMTLSFQLALGASSHDLKQAKDIAARVIAAEPDALLDRVHCVRLSDVGAEFEGVYFIRSANLKVALDAQERIILGLTEGLGLAGLSMAQSERSNVRSKAKA